MNEGLINLKVLNKKEAQQESLLAFGKETRKYGLPGGLSKHQGHCS